MYSIFSGAYGYYIVGSLQIICILHALKTSRRDWLYLVIFLPGIGAIIYIIREILPGLRLSGINGSDVKSFYRVAESKNWNVI